jgi:putative ABC transport system permease protein
MLSLQRTLSLRYLRRRLGRSVLVVLSIALGVSMLVCTWALSQNMSQAARNAANPVAGVSDLTVANGDSGVPRGLVRELREAHLPGVRTVNPLVLGRVALPDLGNRSALLTGVELGDAGTADAAGKRWGLELAPNTRGLLYAKARGLPPAFVGKLLDAELPPGALELAVRVGTQVKTVVRSGTVDAPGAASALGGSAVFLDRDAAARLLDRPDVVTRIDLTLDPGADVEAARQRVRGVVGDRAQVQTPQANQQSVNDIMAGLETGFKLGGVCALVVGLFLVYNALSVAVAERRHDIGILRSLGATRFQVAALFTGEACLLGLVGSALGVPLGWGIGYLLLGPFRESLSNMAGATLEMGDRPPLGPDTVLLALGAGTAAALLAALVPALTAAGEEPADAVRRAPPAGRAARRLLHAGFCTLLVLAGLALIAGRHYLAPRVGTFGGLALAFVGMLAATPLLAAAAAGLIRPLLRLLPGVSARLAADNLARSPGRTGLVIGALAAGVALLIQTAGVTTSSETEALDWIDRTLAADLFVTAFDPAAPGYQDLRMDRSVGRLLRAVPEVQKAVPVRFQHVNLRRRSDEKLVYLVALDGLAWYAPERLARPLPGIELFPRLREPGAAIVSDNFAAQHQVGVGDAIRLGGPHGPIELHVIGTILDYSWNQGTVFMDYAQYSKDFDDKLVDVYEVYLRPAAATGQGTDAVAEAIRRRWSLEERLFVQTRPELRGTVRTMLRRLSVIAYAQEVVVVLVAALGVLTALLISVLQRRRELGLLRAVGASRAQVLCSVLAEAALVGLVGSVIGVLFGIPLEWYAVRVILLDETGFTFPVRVPWPQAAAVILLGLGVAILAGLLPALRAVRLRIADAIAYE